MPTLAAVIVTIFGVIILACSYLYAPAMQSGVDGILRYIGVKVCGLVIGGAFLFIGLGAMGFRVVW